MVKKGKRRAKERKKRAASVKKLRRRVKEGHDRWIALGIGEFNIRYMTSFHYFLLNID